MGNDSHEASHSETTALAIPTSTEQPIPRDLLKDLALDVGKEVAAYIERMYPRAVEAASSTFLLAVRNRVHNEIVETMGLSSIGEIEQRLARRKQERRQLRAVWKAARTVKVGEHGKVDDILAGRVPLEPDL
jgi:hypothetical protein